MKGSLLLFFVQLVTVISAVPIGHKKSKGSKRSDSGDNVFSSTLDFNTKLHASVMNIHISGQNFSVIVDTTSTDTIVGTSKKFIASNTTVLSGQLTGVEIPFPNATGGFDLGEIIGATGKSPIISIRLTKSNLRGILLVSDSVILSESGLVVTNATFASAFVIQPAILSNIDGYLGIGFTPTNDSGLAIPTVVDVATTEGAIPEDTVGLSLNFPKSLNSADLENTGQISFGGVDESLFCGPLQFTPVSGSGELWTVNSPVVSLGNTSLITNATLILDSASVRTYVPPSVFEEYVQLSGAIVDAQGFAHFTPDQASKLDDLTFEIGGVPYKLIAQAQTFPQAINPMFGNYSTSDIIGVIGSSESILPNDTISLGESFLVEYYSAFKKGDNVVGLAVSIDSAQGCPSSVTANILR